MSEQAFFLDDRTFVQFRDYIYELTGINYTDGKRYLLDTRVRRRAQEMGMTDGLRYLDYLKNNAQREKEVNLLIDQVSTHETSFFRHVNQINTFSKLAAALIDARRAAGYRKIKIWSSACSTGEEPYTLAMTLAEYAREHPGFNWRVTASDLSTRMLDRAREGVYRLERIKELCGHDLSSTDGREKLGLGLTAMRVLGIPAPRDGDDGS